MLHPIRSQGSRFRRMMAVRVVLAAPLDPSHSPLGRFPLLRQMVALPMDWMAPLNPIRSPSERYPLLLQGMAVQVELAVHLDLNPSPSERFLLLLVMAVPVALVAPLDLGQSR